MGSLPNFPKNRKHYQLDWTLHKRQFSSVLNEGTEDGIFLMMMQKSIFSFIFERFLRPNLQFSNSCFSHQQ